MTILKSIMIAASLLVANPEATVSGTYSSSPETVYKELMTTIRDQVSFPEFARDITADTKREIVVQVQFRIDDNNNIELLKVSGSDKRINSYVFSELDGKKAAEIPVVRNVTFVSTLHFVH